MLDCTPCSRFVRAAATIAVAFMLTEITNAQLIEVPTSMTYQGVLQDNGTPFTGDIDLQFAFYEFESGGAPLGPLFGEIVSTTATCTDGLFTAIIDPGTVRLGENARWLEIRVRPTGVGSYETLAPRQRLTSAPFAVQARGAVSQADGSIAFRSGNTIAASNTSGPTANQFNQPWQSFLAENTGKLASVKFYLKDSIFYFPTSPTVSPVVYVYAGEGVGGTLLGQFGSDDVSFSYYGWIEIAGATDIQINQGGTYTVQLILNDSDLTEFLSDFTDPYPSGRSGTNAIDDMKFEVTVDGWVNPSTQIDAQNVLSHSGQVSLGNQVFPVAELSMGTDGLDSSFLFDDNIALGFSRSVLGLYGYHSNNPAVLTLSRYHNGNGTLTNKWSIAHAGSSGNDRLDISYGTSNLININPTLASISPNGDVGLGTVNPLAPLHIATSSLAINPAALSGESAMISGTDSVFTLYSRNIGAWGSVISLKDVTSVGNLVDNWSIAREASPGSSLNFTFGTNPNGPSNPSLMHLSSSTGALSIGNTNGNLGRLAVTQSADHQNGGIYLVEASSSQSLHIWIGPDDVRHIDAGGTGIFALELNAGGGPVYINNPIVPSNAARKADIQTLTDALTTLLQLRGVSYTKKINGESTIGFIAEEMAVVLPEVVQFDDEDKPTGIAYQKLTALTVEAIKQQQTRIDTLEQRLLRLEQLANP